jgi:hypothetical protein
MVTEQVAPQAASPQPGARMSRWQLTVVGAVVVLAAAIGLVLGFAVLSPRANPLSGAASYVPGDAVMYFEARLDQSPAQAQALQAVLQRFPAVDADKPLLETIGSLIDRGMAGSGSPITFADDVDPWFDGRVGVAVLDYPISSISSGQPVVPKMAVLFGVDDPAAASAFSDKISSAMESAGTSTTSTQDAGVTIWSTNDPSLSAMDGGGVAFAIADDQVLVSNRGATIETLLDTHSGSESFAAREELQQLASHLPTDWTGFYALDTAQILEQMKAALQQSDPSVADMLDPYLANAATFSAGTIGFASDALVLDAAATAPSGDQAIANSRRDLAAKVPGDALFFADAGNVGSGLTAFVTTMRAAVAAQPDGGQTAQMLDQAEAALGADLQDFVSWIGDGAVVAGETDGTPYGGLVLEAADADAAAQRLGQLKSLLQLAAQSGGAQLSVKTNTVADVEVTTISVDTGMSGGDVGPAIPQVVVQYAMQDGTVLIGFGNQFVARSLSLADGSSLADADRFTAAVDRFGGPDNTSVSFLDLAGLRHAVEATAGTALPDSYVQDIKPNLEPFDYMVSVTQVEGDTVIAHAGIVVH